MTNAFPDSKGLGKQALFLLKLVAFHIVLHGQDPCCIIFCYLMHHN